MHRFILVCCLLLALRGFAQPELVPPPPPPEVKFGVGPAQLQVNVLPELDIIDPRFPETQAKARELLLAKNDLDELRALARKVHQIGLDATAAEAWHAMLRAQAQEQVLDRVIMKRTTAYDLPEYLRGWTATHLPPEELERYDRNPLPLPARVIDEQLDRCFPDYAFYIARYPLYPERPDIALPLAANNLFAVKYQVFNIPEGEVWDGPIPMPEVTLITTPDELKAFFLANVRPIPRLEDQQGKALHADTQPMQDTAAAWLLLVKELHQDGCFRFTQLATQTFIYLGWPATMGAGGSLQVQPTCGNGGKLTVQLHYDNEGIRLLKIEETVELLPGVRPRDQARKLLDPNPAIRKQAEEELSLMGPESFDYLMRERAAAGPELRANIDALWIKIGKVPPAVEN